MRPEARRTVAESVEHDREDRRLLDAIEKRFGPRAHLQPKEIAELLGLKEARTVNGWINDRELLASSPPGCKRLRFVEIDALLDMLRRQRLAEQSPTPPHRQTVRNQPSRTRVVRETAAVAHSARRMGARSVG